MWLLIQFGISGNLIYVVISLWICHGIVVEHQRWNVPTFFAAQTNTRRRKKITKRICNWNCIIVICLFSFLSMSPTHTHLASLKMCTVGLRGSRNLPTCHSHHFTHTPRWMKGRSSRWRCIFHSPLFVRFARSKFKRNRQRCNKSDEQVRKGSMHRRIVKA